MVHILTQLLLFENLNFKPQRTVSILFWVTIWWVTLNFDLKDSCTVGYNSK